MNINEVISLIATIGSAFAGGFAARAAYLSANSATRAQNSAEKAESRAALRELSATSSRVVVEEGRIQIVGNDVQRAHRTLAMNTGNFPSSRLTLFIGETDKKMITAAELAKDAALFSDGAKCLHLSPLDEIERVYLVKSNRFILFRVFVTSLRKSTYHWNLIFEIANL